MKNIKKNRRRQREYKLEGENIGNREMFLNKIWLIVDVHMWRELVNPMEYQPFGK
jgi:hypothetical protein